ncbi:MAG: hypothetical protein MK078_18035 [Crocinitomicaceae bacterium]|nr:hypothetical protein [Crocinitomicaceae bacterium]
MMKRRDDLFELIQSLSPSETRYVSLNLKGARKKETDYLKLFNYIRGLKSYDEKVLRERFHGEKFVNQLDVKKHYLYDSIVKHLLSYKFSKSRGKRVDEHVEILIQKGLLHQALHLIENTLKDKLEKEDFSMVLRLLDQLEKLSQYLTQEIDRTEVLEKMEKNLERYQNHFKYNTLYIKVRSLVQKYTFVRSDSMAKTFEQVLQSPLLKSEDKAISKSARYLFHEILYLITASSGDWEKAYSHAEEQVKMLEEINSPYFSKEWIPAIYPHLISATIHLKKFDLAQKHLNALFQIQNTKANKANHHYCFFQLMELNKAEDIDNLQVKVKEHEEYLKEEKGNMPFTLGNYYAYELAKSYFILEDYRQAQRVNQQVINSAIDAEYSLDLYSFASILDIILSVELESLDLMEVQCRTAKNIMQKREVYYSLEQTFIEFAEKNFIDLSKHPNKENLKVYEEFRNAIKKEIDQPLNGAVESYLDLRTWCDDLVARCG